jgi:hypothetical protein
VPHPEVRVALGSPTPLTLCSCIGGVVQVVCENPIPLAIVLVSSEGRGPVEPNPPPPCRSRLPPAGCRVPHPEVRLDLGSHIPLCSCIGGVVQVVCENLIPLASVSE